MASCAIPGWYSPVRIGADRYVDGGACSSTSVDLLAGAGLDEVWVVAPSVSFLLDSPEALATRLERQWRVRVTRRCLREVAKVHAGGTEVTVLGPGPEDLDGHRRQPDGRRPPSCGPGDLAAHLRRGAARPGVAGGAAASGSARPSDAVGDAADLDGEATSEHAPAQVTRRAVGD